MTQSVLQVCLSTGWGGLEMYPIRIGIQLKARNWRIFGLALEGSRVAEEMKAAGFEVTVVSSKGEAIRQLFRLVKLLKDNDISVIHCHKSGDLLIGALLKQFLRFRLIFTEHMGVTKPKKDLYHRWIYKQVDQVLSISRFTLAKNINALPIAQEKISYLWLGTEFIEPDITIQQVRELFPIKEKSLVIALPGRLSPGKGHLILLDAISLLKKNYSMNDLYIFFVGGVTEQDGADINYIKKLKEKITTLGLDDKIIFTGFQKNIANTLQLADIICILSESEAFGLTTIESMRLGKKIVASNTGALPEVIENKGFLVSPYSSEDIANAILELQKSAYDYLKDEAKERATTFFSMEKHIDGLIRQYS